MELVHTAEEAVNRFTLIAGPGGEDRNEACVMTAIAWMAGEAWTDSPACANRTLRSLAIRANDDPGTTPEMRAELVRAGETGLVDTWWVPTEVVLVGLSKAGQEATTYDRTLAAVRYVADWKITKERPNLAGANLAGANLAGANLAGANLAGAYGDGLTVLPAGWMVSDSGLIVKDAK